MKYVMFVVTSTEPDVVTDESDVDIWVDELEKSGKRIMGDALERPEKATVVKVRDGKRIVTDGPFAESREWIAGFDVLECENLEEAIEIASKHPMARNGQLEIRQFMLWE